MNKKLRRIIACLALVLGITGTAVATNVLPASAYLTNCTATKHFNYPHSYGTSVCTNYSGTPGYQQVRIKCYATITWVDFGGPVWGPVVSLGQVSTAYCPPNHPYLSYAITEVL